MKAQDRALIPEGGKDTKPCGCYENLVCNECQQNRAAVARWLDERIKAYESEQLRLLPGPDSTGYIDVPESAVYDHALMDELTLIVRSLKAERAALGDERET